MPNVQRNGSSVRQDREIKQPHWLLKVISAVLAPLGVPWAKKVQEEVARLKREAEEAARQSGRQKADEISGRGPKQP
jgi:hypothetical protein